MKTLLLLSLTLVSLNAFSVDMGGPDYNQKRAIALVDAKLLGERERLGLSMERYRIISDVTNSKGNFITVGVAGPGGECTVRVSFIANGRIELANPKCRPGS